MCMQFEAEAEEEQIPAPWYRKRSLWVYWIPAIISLCLLVIGIVMVVFYRNIKVIYFEARPPSTPAQQSCTAAMHGRAHMHNLDVGKNEAGIRCTELMGCNQVHLIGSA